MYIYFFFGQGKKGQKLKNKKSSQFSAEPFTVKLTIDYKTRGCLLSKMVVFISKAQRVGIQQPFQFGEAFSGVLQANLSECEGVNYAS